MKTKKWKTFLACAAAVCALAGCSDKDLTDNSPVVNPGDDPKEKAYMSVTVQLPTAAPGTRGGTDSGTEVGQDYENSVSELLLVLATRGNEYVTHALVEGKDLPSTQTTGSIPVTAEFNRTGISKFYGEDGKVKNNNNHIHVFVFCNPTEELKNSFTGRAVDPNWYDRTCTVNDGKKEAESSVWSENKFLMSNAKIEDKQIPSEFSKWQTVYTSATSPFRLTGTNQLGAGIVNGDAISVQRSVARLDFRDGSGNDNTYDIGPEENKDALKVKLIRMALVNMSKEFYYLHRVSNDGLNASSILLGQETSSNYVVDTDADFKKSGTLNNKASQLTNHFHFSLFNDKGTLDGLARGGWDHYKIREVLSSGKDDNDDSWNQGNTKGNYKIWRYVTENTIPGLDKQKNGVSTGIVFKGKLEAGETTGLDEDVATHYQALYNAIEGRFTDSENKEYTNTYNKKKYPILFCFQTNLYAGWNAVQEAAKDEKNAALQAACTEELKNKYTALVTAAKTNQNYEGPEFDEFRAAATKASFTLYQASDDAGEYNSDEEFGVGYYCYYYYWNRHNDNGMPGTQGTMEFAVVRNNVYKLAVTSVSKFGHPRIPGNDPDPLDPDDPDESGDTYLTMDVQVLPWVVRENKIEF